MLILVSCSFLSFDLLRSPVYFGVPLEVSLALCVCVFSVGWFLFLWFLRFFHFHVCLDIVRYHIYSLCWLRGIRVIR